MTPIDPAVQAILTELWEAQRENPKTVERLPTGSVALDLAIGGGWPRGRLIEIFGQESTGKSLLAYTSLGRFQKYTGGIGILQDVESSATAERLTTLGIDLSMFIWNRPETLEEGYSSYLGILRKLREKCLKNKLHVPPIMCIYDSIGGGTSIAELQDDEIKTSENAIRARVNNGAIRRIMSMSQYLDATHIWINHVRANIRSFGYGKNYIVPGGSGVAFHSSVRTRMQYTGMVKKSEKIVGATAKISIIKNKVSSPFGNAEISWDFEKGINPSYGLIEILLERGVLEREGASKNATHFRFTKAEYKNIVVNKKNIWETVLACKDLINDSEISEIIGRYS